MPDPRRFACVVSDPGTWTRVEPGVRRLPTVFEQHRALSSWASRLGGVADDVPVVVDPGDPAHDARSIAEVARFPTIDGVLCFSTECITCPTGFDLATVVRTWGLVGFLGFLVEDLAISDDASLGEVLEMLVVVDQVGGRDRDQRWTELVMTGAFP